MQYKEGDKVIIVSHQDSRLSHCCGKIGQVRAIFLNRAITEGVMFRVTYDEEEHGLWISGKNLVAHTELSETIYGKV